MPQVPHWQDPAGLEAINLNIIVKKPIPKWMNGLHEVQLNFVSAILDRKDVFAVLQLAMENRQRSRSQLLYFWNITNTQRHM